MRHRQVSVWAGRHRGFVKEVNLRWTPQIGRVEVATRMRESPQEMRAGAGAGGQEWRRSAQGTGGHGALVERSRAKSESDPCLRVRNVTFLYFYHSDKSL